jgi:hypothetical protein
MHPNHRLENRADREAAAPNLGRDKRSRASIAETDPKNGEVLEDFAGGEISDALAVPKAVATGTPAVPAPPTTKTRGLDQGSKVPDRADRCSVGRQVQGE